MIPTTLAKLKLKLKHFSKQDGRETASVSDFPLLLSAEFAGLQSAERLQCLRLGFPKLAWFGVFNTRSIFKTLDGVANSCLSVVAKKV